MPVKPRHILTIESLEKFERVINRDFRPYEINMMVMPGTLEDKHKNCDNIPALRRQFNLIYIFLEGEHDVKLGAEHTQLRPHDLVIVPENTVYASDHIKNCKGYCIHFKTEHIRTLLSRSLTDEFPYFQQDREHIISLNLAESELIQQSFKNIVAEYDRFSPEKDHILVNLTLILLLRIREIYRLHVREINKNISRHDQLANQFKRSVEKNFMHLRSVQAYAEKLFVSPSHLSDMVRKSAGRSPLDIIHDTLYLEARVLLRSTEKSIAEISQYLNFEDQSHFSHFVKKRSGMSPLQLRNTL